MTCRRHLLLLLVLVLACVVPAPAPLAPSSSLRWGTLRPNVYFGARQKSASSALIGVLWYNADDPAALRELRHDCEERDGLERYGWLAHDGKSFGTQEIIDSRVGINLTTSFLHAAALQGDEAIHRRSPEAWTAVFNAKPLRREHVNASVGLIWYVAVPSRDKELQTSIDGRSEARAGELKDGLAPDVARMSASGADFAPFQVEVRALGGGVSKKTGKPRKHRHSTSSRVRRHKKDPAKSKAKQFRMAKTYFEALRQPLDRVWDVKPVVEQRLSGRFRKMVRQHGDVVRAKRAHFGETLDDMHAENAAVFQETSMLPLRPTLVNKVRAGSNLFLFQQVLKPPFSFQMTFTEFGPEPAASTGEPGDDEAPPSGEAMPIPSSSAEQMRVLLDSSRRMFERDFAERLNLSRSTVASDELAVAHAALSNMVGGIGFFSGRGRMQREGGPVRDGPEQQLLSAVPSRSFFPRGFLWDEGFHQLLIQRWDLELSREILEHWMALVDNSGWLPREQILGLEARRRVPEEFQVQRPTIANPPTLVLAIQRMLELVDTSAESQQIAPTTAFLERIFDKLVVHVEWYFRTQASAVDGAFAWKERTLDHCLASGLDDYPRASYLSESEGHVDLYSWMIVLSDTVARIARWLAEKHDVSTTSGAEQAEILRTTAVRFEGEATQLRARLDEFHWDEEAGMYADFIVNPNTTSREFVRHVGYVTLFPLLMRLVPPDSPHLGKLLDVIADRKQLWTEYGLRSLSRSDEQYGTRENYWRGPIWININYLAVSALHHYGHDEAMAGPHQQRAARLYGRLRKNLVSNIVKNYHSTGYLWEQYNPDSGKGQRSHPFTGWTALVVLMMGEQF